MGVACALMGEGRGVYRVLVGKPEGKRPLGRPRRRWEDFFFYLYIGHAPLLSVVLPAVLQFIYICFRISSTVHCLLVTLLHIVKVYRFNKPAKDLLVLVDQVLFARWPRSYMLYHSFSLCSGVQTYIYT